MKRLQRGTNLNSLTSFDDARLLLDENINMVIILELNLRQIFYANHIYLIGRIH